MATEATTAREQAIAAARISIDTIMGFDGLPQPDIEQQVRLLIAAHEAIMRLQDQPELRHDAELETLAMQLRQKHHDISKAASYYIAFPIDAEAMYFGVDGIQCNGYTTYLVRTRDAFNQVIWNARQWGYELWDIGSTSSHLDLYGGSRGSHSVMIYGPKVEQLAA